MHNVFLSYSRQDINFVRHLVDSLKAHHRESWVDWQDIPLTADWWSEVCAGIEAADTFVFVISPKSLASPVCNLEIAHARMHNKRIVPVVRVPADAQRAFDKLSATTPDDATQASLAGRDLVAVARENWVSLSRHNWLFFQDDAAFDQSFDQLLQAIDTDLEYVREHTRLLVRAREWENKGRNRSYLLGGDDLRSAEAWQSSSAGKEPAPTELQALYILDSRRAANQRQRSLLLGVSVALVVAIALAVLSFFLFLRSEEQRTLANNNAATATVAQGEAQQNAVSAVREANNRATQQVLAQNNAATAEGRATEVSVQAATSEANFRTAVDFQTHFLADLSRQQLDNAHNVLPALLLALEGMRYYPDMFHRENLDALQSAFSAPGLEVMGVRHDDSASGARLNKDNTRLLTWSFDGTARVWDVATGEQLLVVRHPSMVVDARWNADESRILTASYDNTARVWDAATGDEILRLLHSTNVNEAHWNEDESRIITEMGIYRPDDDPPYHYVLVTWDAMTGELLSVKRRPAEEYIDPTDQSRRVVLQNNEAWLKEGEKARLLPHPYGVYVAAWKPDGRMVVTGSGDNFLRVWRDGALFATLPGVMRGDGLAFNRDGSRLMTFSLLDSNVIIWDTTGVSPVPLYTLSNPGNVHVASWSADGIRLLVAGERRIGDDVKGYATIWNTTTGELMVTINLNDSCNVFDCAIWVMDDTRMLTWTDGGDVNLWSVGSLPSIDARQSTPLHRVVYTQDETHALVELQVAGEGDTLYAGYAVLWDVASDSPLFTMNAPEPIGWFQFNDDDTLVMARGRSCLYIWDVTTGDLQSSICPGDDLNIWSDAAWVGGGENILAIIGANDFNTPTYAAIWNTRAGDERVRFPHKTRVSRAVINGDGTRVVTTGSREPDAIIWDAQTGARLFTLTHPDTPFSPHWNPDSTRIVTSDSEKAFLWDATTGQQIAALDSDEKIFTTQWSPSGRYLTTRAQTGREVTIWDGATGARVVTLTGLNDAYFGGLSWNADETQLAVLQEGFVHIRAIPSGDVVGDFPSSEAGFYLAQGLWSADSSLMLVWANRGDSFEVADVAGSEPVYTVRIGVPIRTIRWIENGILAEVETDYGKTLRYTVDTPALIEEARAHAHRGFTNDELATFFMPTLEPTATPVPVTREAEPTSTAAVLLTPPATFTPLAAATAAPIRFVKLEDMLTALELIAPDAKPSVTVPSLTVDLSDDDNTVRWEQLEGSFADFVVGGLITIRTDRTDVYDSCGFTLREADQDNLYTVEYDQTGKVWVNELRNGQWITHEVGSYPATGAQEHRLIVAARGETVDVYMDGQAVGTLEGVSNRAGRVSLYGATFDQTERWVCQFTNVRLYSLDQ